MTVSNRFRRLAGGACAGLILAWAPALAAQSPEPLPLSTSPLGSYLAARHAGTQRDAAAAATYYFSALRADPHNGELLERAFLSVLAEGNIDQAAKLAERLIHENRSGPLTKFVLGVRSLKQKQYRAARPNFVQAVHAPITDLAPTLLLAWSYAGSGDVRHAIETIDKLNGPDWYGLFTNLNAGLILDLAGHKKDAGKRYEKAYQLDPTMLPVVEAYGSWLSRNDTKQKALDVFSAFDKVLPRHPLILDAMAKLKRGQSLPPLVDSPISGGAEVLYGIGASFGRRGGEDLGLIYLQLALYLVPSHPLALLSLADLYESIKQPELAIRVYRRVPARSPLHRNASIQLAIDLDSLDHTAEAKDHLQKLIAESPKDNEAIMALGNILRARKDYAACADAYSKSIADIGTPTKADWVVFYFRGICYERDKHWDKAEADLKKALELFPDQPQVLNYLGYSWIDQGLNLDEGMKMIRRAVEQRPDDGYIVDSLGWAYFRVGNYDEAVKNLERAVEIKPEDPTINDHLGDAYWRVGRQLEARFQWAHARDLKPEPEDLVKIEQKLKSGLPPDTSSAAQAEKPKKPGSGG